MSVIELKFCYSCYCFEMLIHPRLQFSFSLWLANAIQSLCNAKIWHVCSIFFDSSIARHTEIVTTHVPRNLMRRISSLFEMQFNENNTFSCISNYNSKIIRCVNFELRCTDFGLNNKHRKWGKRERDKRSKVIKMMLLAFAFQNNATQNSQINAVKNMLQSRNVNQNWQFKFSVFKNKKHECYYRHHWHKLDLRLNRWTINWMLIIKLNATYTCDLIQFLFHWLTDK